MKATLIVLAGALLTLAFCPRSWAVLKDPVNKEDKLKIISQEWRLLDRRSGPVEEKNEQISLRSETKNEEGLPSKYHQKVSLKMAGVPLKEALKPIEEILGTALLYSPGVEDKPVSVDVKETEIARVLSMILFPFNYGFKHAQGNLIILAQDTRSYRLILPPLTQGFRDLTSNESSVESSGVAAGAGGSNINQQVKLGTKIVVSSESSGISFWDDVKDNLRLLMTSSGSFSMNKQSGEVVVTDAPLNLQRIGVYFDEMNRKLMQQIEVDVKVVEVVLDRSNKFGIDWNALAAHLKDFNAVSLASSFASEHFTGGSFFKIKGELPKQGSGVLKGGVSVVIEALAKQGDVQIVSQPRLRMLNNQLAVIQVGSTQSFINNSTVQVTQTGTVTSLSTSQVQEGVTMRLLANMVGDDIYMSVAPVITTIDKIRSITSGNTTIEAPQTTTKSINTLVKLKEGESVAIGGLMTSDHQRHQENVPVLSRMPVLGKLFQYKEDVENKRELIIFITPRRG